MPHLTFECTDNIYDAAALPALLKRANEVLIAQDGVYPTGGIRSRAIRLADYCVADGSADDAFVHATLKIGSGRSPDTKQRTGDALFRLMTPAQQQILFSNTAGSIGGASREVQIRHIRNCTKADPAYGAGIAKALGIPLTEVQ